MMYLQALLLIFQNPLKTREGCLRSTAPFRSHQIDDLFWEAQGEKMQKVHHKAFSISELNNILDKEAELDDMWLQARCRRFRLSIIHTWFYESAINTAVWNLPIVNF